ncbi:hypothetical protein Tco_0805475 [Tanacetum coccineum]
MLKCTMFKLVTRNSDGDCSVPMSADVARGHGGDDGGDDRPSPHQIPTGCGGCLGNRGKGTRKPNLGGRRAGRLHTRQETRNLGLKAITDKSGPAPIRFEFDDKETLMPLGEHAVSWGNTTLWQKSSKNYLHVLFGSCRCTTLPGAKCRRSRRRGSWKGLGIRSLATYLCGHPATSTMARRLLLRKGIGFLTRIGLTTWSASDNHVPRTFPWSSGNEQIAIFGKIPRIVPGMPKNKQKETTLRAKSFKMVSSATRVVPVAHPIRFFLTLTLNGDEMLRLQGLGSNTETGVPYTEDEIMAIVRWGKYNHKKSQGFVRNEDQISGARADEYESADVMMALSVEEPVGLDHGFRGLIPYDIYEDYFFNFEEYNSGNVLLGDGRECRVWGTGTSSVQVLQGVEFEVEPREDHAFEVERLRNVGQPTGSQKVQTKYLIYYHLARDREQHSAHELFRYIEDSNEAAFAVAIVEKIYAHESSLNFNDTITCEVISIRKDGLKENMDARSDVYVLSNGCKECSNDINDYYWEYTLGLLVKAKGNVHSLEIIKDQSDNTLRVLQSRDYDVEKRKNNHRKKTSTDIGTSLMSESDGTLNDATPRSKVVISPFVVDDTVEKEKLIPVVTTT